MSFDAKYFLDLNGLEVYDELIKAYIDTKSNAEGAALTTEIARATAAEEAISAALQELTDGAVADNAAAIATLNGDGEGSVAKAVEDAITALVDNAPETLDTLKEIADWISADETGTAALIDRVSDNEDAIEELQAADETLKVYIDAQDEALYNSIQPVSVVGINSLFPAAQGDQTAAEAIASMDEGTALELNENQTITESIVIDKPVYIDAKNSTFTGTVTVAKDKEVIIENAVFAQPVVLV